MDSKNSSCILCPIPEPLLGEIRAWSLEKVPDEFLSLEGRVNDLHVSVKYGLHSPDLFFLKEVLWSFGRIDIELQTTSVFKMPQHDVLKIDVRSDGLHELHRLLAATFNHTEEYPRYRPHITIAYLRSFLGEKLQGMDVFDGRKTTLEMVAFSGSDYREFEMPLGP